jgi:hypothetical protein
MPKFYFECESWDGVKNTIAFDAEYLETIKENINLFLKGAGFVIDENIDENENLEDEIYLEPEYNPDVFSHMVNDLSTNPITMDKIEGETFILNDEPICQVCNLPKEVMLRHKCFDENCGLNR